jgi:hypothetical protein
VVADDGCSPEVVVATVSMDLKGLCDGLNVKKTNERTKCQGMPMTHFDHRMSPLFGQSFNLAMELSYVVRQRLKLLLGGSSSRCQTS